MLNYYIHFINCAILKQKKSLFFLKSFLFLLFALINSFAFAAAPKDKLTESKKQENYVGAAQRRADKIDPSTILQLAMGYNNVIQKSSDETDSGTIMHIAMRYNNLAEIDYTIADVDKATVDTVKNTDTTDQNIIDWFVIWIKELLGL